MFDESLGVVTASAIPVTILTGFLGAGKTTLLRSILTDADSRNIGVLVNDFGEINVDAALVVESTAQSISLANGCVCCSIQGELVTVIQDLIATRSDLERIMIEASGLSRSLPLADMMMAEELREIVKLDAMFCLVDAISFPEMPYAQTQIAIDQIVGADVIVLTKTDLVTEQNLAALETTLSGLMPKLSILHSANGNLPLDVVFGPRPAPTTAGESSENELSLSKFRCSEPEEHHPECNCVEHLESTENPQINATTFGSWSWRSEAALDEQHLRAKVRHLDRDLYRAKGVFRVVGEDGKMSGLEFQKVGKRSAFIHAEIVPPQNLFVAIGLAESLRTEALQELFSGMSH